MSTEELPVEGQLGPAYCNVCPYLPLLLEKPGSCNPKISLLKEPSSPGRTAELQQPHRESAAQEQQRRGGSSLTFMQPSRAECAGGEGPACIASEQRRGREGEKEQV